MRVGIAIVLGVVLLPAACGERDDGAGTPGGEGPVTAAPMAEGLPSLLMVRGPAGFRCEASVAPRPEDPAVEIVVQGDGGRILARGPAEAPLCFELAPTTRGRISTIVRYASGEERRRETVLP